MATRTYQFQNSDFNTLQISWKTSPFSRSKNHFAILLDDSPLDLIEDQQEMQDGKEYTLPDHSRLKVLLGADDMIVLHDGHAISAQPKPFAYLKVTYKFIYLLGIMLLLIGILSIGSQVLRQIDVIYPAWLSGIALLLGIVFVLLGYFASRQFLWALWLTIILVICQTLLMDVYLRMIVEERMLPDIGGIFVAVFISIMAYASIQEVKANSKAGEING